MARRKRMHGRRRRSAFKKGDPHKAVLRQGKTPLSVDDVQAGLSGAGLVYPPADALNAVISAGRGIYHLVKGEKTKANKQLKNTVLNTMAIVPGGEVLKLNKFTKATKQPEKLYDAFANPTTQKTIQSIGNVGYWDSTVEHVKNKKKK